MSITADLDGKNYVLGRGKVYFDRFDANADIDGDTVGVGYRYFGNTPSFALSMSAENLDHFDADEGVKEKDDSVQLTLNRSSKLECDNISIENLALMYLGAADTLSQASATGVVDLITVKQGYQYQLGQSETNPTGNRSVSNVVVKKGTPGFATTVVATGNYQYDAELGMLLILDGAVAIPDDTVLQVTYDVAAVAREQVISGSNSIYGALKFVADNPKGVNRDVYIPYVKIAPDGDFALKGDDWQKMSFTLEILKRGALEAVYIDGRPA